MYCKNMNCMERNLSPKQLQLFNTLRRLWFEHVMWTRSFIVSAVFDLGDLDQVTKRLLRNPTDFASVLKPLYGQQASLTFEKLFTDHLLIAAQLVAAAKEGNVSSVDAQRKIWYLNAVDIANFLVEINPCWNNKHWKEMLFEHLEMTENEAVQILSGQYAMSLAQYDAIQEQALMMADDMACGIIRQFRI